MIHDTVSKIAEPWSLFYNSAKNLQFFFFKMWASKLGSSSQSLLGMEEGGRE